METIDTAIDRILVPGGITALSTSNRKTLAHLYSHPIAHNLEWSDVIALLSALGTVEHKANNETSVRIGGEHQLLRRPHSKDLTTDEVTTVRHFMTRIGQSMTEPKAGSDTNDILVAIEHHEARIYHLDLRPADPANHVIKPYDPHHFLHHLTHKDESRERGQRAEEDPTFYERIAQAVAGAVPHGRIVVVGHGKGHSDAAHHLVEWLRVHHDETFRRLVPTLSADLSAVTPPQLLALGREALALSA